MTAIREGQVNPEAMLMQPSHRQRHHSATPPVPQQAMDHPAHQDPQDRMASLVGLERTRLEVDKAHPDPLDR